jgi:hypothetical protein
LQYSNNMNPLKQASLGVKLSLWLNMIVLPRAAIERPAQPILLHHEIDVITDSRTSITMSDFPIYPSISIFPLLNELYKACTEGVL